MSIPVYYSESGGSKLFSSEPPSPSSKCEIEYLNEGGANFVFKILPGSEGSDVPAKLQKKLLRLRKNLSHVQSAADQLAAFNQSFKDVFPAENVVQHELVALDRALPIAINAALKKLVRPSHRLLDFLPDDEKHGVLVTDMTPQPGDLLVQIKPKWLTQSPNAPPNAKRCRTCALRAQRASQRTRTATDAQETCPLNLISEHEHERKAVAQAITSDETLQNYLSDTAQAMLQKLRASQMILDAHGTLKTSDTEGIYNLCKAMTLRDCTLFLRRRGDVVEARFADLDLKQPEKLTRWKKIEHDLINDGWYTNSEEEEVWKKERICLLARRQTRN